ncbi:MAG: SusD/RagB family nutrient-binding outer membrane lipoprotein [Flavobacteriaceae bacterium]|nr:SusD/RagB family nutrient-binding outer membrane lipoprotein [Flavobacteriaceae bacterium]MDG2386068.1 SusD/RagB family nutrient-binding outer membrane lipoprotein [Flavobacteriaceae bacterium]
MKYTNYILGLCMSTLLVLVSCETTELDLTDNPNALSPSQADPTFFLNSIQIDFAFWVNSMGDRGAELTRINYMSGRTYNNIYSPDSWNGIWSSAYRGMLEDIRLMNLLAEEAGLNYHRGMGKVFEAYILMTLVDYFGDIPYTEALQGGEGILNPEADSGASVYSAAIALLDSSIADFIAEGPVPSNDYFYGGDASKWIKAANSIKKKALLNQGDFSAYNAISNYISEPEDDFQFSWGTSAATPDTRHPYYRSSYTSTGGNEYMSNWMMFKMLNGHGGNTDPRINYYFYRQVSETPGFDSAANEEVLECGLPGYYVPPQLRGDDTPFCAPTNSASKPAGGYWGRDHGNDNGIPPDGFLKTLRGVYPAGGTFDDRSFSGQIAGDGLAGAGITPVMLSSWMHFMNAEVAVSTGGDPTSETLTALEQALNKADDLGGPEMAQEDVDAYVAAFTSDWSAASSVSEKLDMWATEFFISMAGNGIDAYNSYRRNGFPRDVQPNIEPDPGQFPLIQYYPANYVNTNKNASQRANKNERVFWNSNGPSNLK